VANARACNSIQRGPYEGEDLPTNSLCVVRRVAAKKREAGETACYSYQMAAAAHRR
jgi:hypothetical protein